MIRRTKYCVNLKLTTDPPRSSLARHILMLAASSSYTNEPQPCTTPSIGSAQRSSAGCWS